MALRQERRLQDDNGSATGDIAALIEAVEVDAGDPGGGFFRVFFGPGVLSSTGVSEFASWSLEVWA